MVEQVVAFFANIDPLTLWLGMFVVGGLLAGVVSGYFSARKIQPKGFKWKHFGREVLWGALNVTVSAFVLGGLTTFLRANGFIQLNPEPASGWVIAAQFALYFIGFDTYF